MNTTFSFEQLDGAVGAYAEAHPDDAAATQAKTVLQKVAEFARSKNLTARDVKATESLGEVVQFNGDVQFGSDVTLESLRDLAVDCGVAKADLPNVERELYRQVMGGSSKQLAYAENKRTLQSGTDIESVSLEQFAGASAANFLRGDTKVSMEAFGLDIDKLQQDNRLSMAVAIMRPFKSIIDELLPRITGSSDVVTISVVNPELYNIAVVNSKSGEVRNNRKDRIPLVLAHQNPACASTAPVRLTPNAAVDTTAPYKLVQANKAFFVPGQSINLLDICYDPTVTFNNGINNTDLIAPGGRLSKLLFTMTGKPSGGSAPVDELYTLDVAWMQYANLTQNPNNWDSGESNSRCPINWGLSAASIPDGSKTPTALATFTDAKIRIDGQFTTNANLKTALADGSGSFNITLVPLDGADESTISDKTKTAFAALKISLTGWAPELYYDEENLRKTTAAVVSNYSQKQFQVPMGKNFFAEYQLSQTADQNTVNAVTSYVALGNTSRGVTIITNRLADVAAAIAFEKANAEFLGITPVRVQSLAGSLVIPTVMTDILDYSDAGTAVMRESERLTEVHGRARTRLTALTSRLHANSMYLTNMDSGEEPWYNVLVYRTEADLIFGINDYHEAYKDGVTYGEGKDTYDIKLPNGVNLHVVKTDILEYKGKVLAIPVRKNKPTDITSFGRIQDCGLYSATYTPVDLGAAWRRAVVNSREIVFPTNASGIQLTIVGLKVQAGAAADNG